MSRVISKTDRIPPSRRFPRFSFAGRPLRILSPSALFLAAFAFSPASLRCDAYLAEDKIHYGADSYTVDYDKEIVYANGRAYFRKAGRSVRSDRIVIYYARQEKRALFQGRVVASDEEGGYRISGERGESRYALDYYRIEGNAVLEDGSRSVRASVIERKSGGEMVFSGNVNYRDARYEANAPLLRVREGNALFEKGPASAVEVLETESGDRVYCDTVLYGERSGDLIFSGDALFIRGLAKSPSGPALVIRAEEIRYLRGSDTFYLAGNVFAFDDSMSLSAPEAEYARKDGVMNARGGALLREGERTVRGFRMRVELGTRRVMLYDDARGVFEAR